MRYSLILGTAIVLTGTYAAPLKGEHSSSLGLFDPTIDRLY